MKTKLIAVLSAMAVSWLALVFSNTAVAQYARPGGAESSKPKPPTGGTSASDSTRSQGKSTSNMATPISPEEAAKKYPPPKGKYPLGERDPHKASGIIASPYPPRVEYDCSQIAHGGLVLDTRVNKVFVRP
jgi:hypothetical protein